jgi:hypothetical protein
MELAFLSAIVGTFTFLWMIIHCIAAIRWPETKKAHSGESSHVVVTERRIPENMGSAFIAPM